MKKVCINSSIEKEIESRIDTFESYDLYKEIKCKTITFKTVWRSRNMFQGKLRSSSLKAKLLVSFVMILILPSIVIGWTSLSAGQDEF